MRALLSFLIFNSIGAPTKIVAKVDIPELLKNVVSSVEKFKLTDVELFAGKDNGTVFGEYAVVTKMKGTALRRPLNEGRRVSFPMDLPGIAAPLSCGDEKIVKCVVLGRITNRVRNLYIFLFRSSSGCKSIARN
jgi:hypothetical protein